MYLLKSLKFHLLNILSIAFIELKNILYDNFFKDSQMQINPWVINVH